MFVIVTLSNLGMEFMGKLLLTSSGLVCWSSVMFCIELSSSLVLVLSCFVTLLTNLHLSS